MQCSISLCSEADRGAGQLFCMATACPKACTNLPFGLETESALGSFLKICPFAKSLCKAHGCHKAPPGPRGSLGISLPCPICGASWTLAGGQTDAIKSKCQIPGGTAWPGDGGRMGWVLLMLRVGFWLSEFGRHLAGIHSVCGGMTQTNLTSSM